MTGIAAAVPIVHPFMMLAWPIAVHGLYRHWPGSPGAFVGGVIGRDERIRLRRGNGAWVSGRIVDRVVLPWVVLLSLRSAWRRFGVVVMIDGSGKEVHRCLRRRLLR